MTKICTVNELGLSEIKEFLSRHHIKGGDHFSRDMLHAWASDAEFQLAEGNPPTIEIRSWDSTSGAPVEYTISNNGLDCKDVEED